MNLPGHGRSIAGRIGVPPAQPPVAAAHDAKPAHQNPKPATQTDDPDDQNGIPVIRISSLGGHDRVSGAQNTALDPQIGDLCRLRRF